MNGWTKTNRNTGIPIMKTQNTSGGNSLPSEFYIEDGSYLRLKIFSLVIRYLKSGWKQSGLTNCVFMQAYKICLR